MNAVPRGRVGRSPLPYFAAVALAVLTGCTAATPVGTSQVPPVASSTGPSQADAIGPTSTVGPIATAEPLSWTTPLPIYLGECGIPDATTDSAGGRHISVSCDGAVHTFGAPDGVTWSMATIVPGIDVLEVQPQLALDGTTLHLAFNRLRPAEPGCEPLDVPAIGVVHLSGPLAVGLEFDQTQLGEDGDRLEAFEVRDGVVHAVVRNEGTTHYVAIDGGSTTRIAIPDALSSSMQIGSDGRPRIAYTTGTGLRLGSVEGGQLTTLQLVDAGGRQPVAPRLVLAADDLPTIAWVQRGEPSQGCDAGTPGPQDGTFVGRLAAGAWATQQVSPAVLGLSAAIDPRSERVHLLVDDGSLHLISAGGDGTWATTDVPNSAGLTGASVQVDPLTGKLWIAAQGDAGPMVMSQD